LPILLAGLPLNAVLAVLGQRTLYRPRPGRLPVVETWFLSTAMLTVLCGIRPRLKQTVDFTGLSTAFGADRMLANE